MLFRSIGLLRAAMHADDLPVVMGRISDSRLHKGETTPRWKHGEIIRAGIESIGKGQHDAARSTGLSAWQTQAYVILPQALRNVLPDLVSNTIEVVKLTSLASVVAFAELLYAAEMARSVTYNASPLVMAAAMYLVLLWPAVRLASGLEHKLR